MSQTLQTPVEVERTHLPAALWRAAGVFALAHVVLLFAGFSQERSTVLDSGLVDAKHAFVDANIVRTMAGGYVESLSFVVLLPALIFLARAVGRRTEVGRWAAQTSLAAGIGYVIVTFASGMPPLGAAVYGGHHGADLQTALMVANIRTFAFYLSLMLLAAQAVALGIAAMSDRFYPRFIGLGGLVVGVLLLIGIAGAGVGLNDFGSMLWIVWWTGVAVCLFRSAGRVGSRSPESAPLRPQMRDA